MTRVYAGAGSRLLPIELNDSVPEQAPFLEGALALRIGDVDVLSPELVPCGYVDDWWSSALDAVGPLLRLQSSAWLLPGKVYRVTLDVAPGTRRLNVQTILAAGPPVSAAAQTRVQPFVDALLDETDRFFEWLPFRDGSAAKDRIRALRAAPAPWRPQR